MPKLLLVHMLQVCVTVTLMSCTGMEATPVPVETADLFEMAPEGFREALDAMGFKAKHWMKQNFWSVIVECYVAINERCDAIDKTILKRKESPLVIYRICCPVH